MLDDIHKLRRLKVCTSLLNQHKSDPFLKRIVTCNDKLLLYNNKVRLGRWIDKYQKPSKFPKHGLHPDKVQLIIWWYHGGLIRYDLLEEGKIIDATRYCKKMKEINKKLLAGQSGSVKSSKVILLHNNAKPHISYET